MSLRGDVPHAEVLCEGRSGEDLASVGVLVNNHEHEFAALVNVLHLSEERNVVGVDRCEPLDGGLVGFGVLVLIVPPVEDSGDLT